VLCGHLSARAIVRSSRQIVSFTLLTSIVVGSVTVVASQLDSWDPRVSAMVNVGVLLGALVFALPISVPAGLLGGMIAASVAKRTPERSLRSWLAYGSVWGASVGAGVTAGWFAVINLADPPLGPLALLGILGAASGCIVGAVVGAYCARVAPQLAAQE